MSKGNWKKAVCSCGACKRCKDRARLDKKKKGVFEPRQPTGRKREKESHERQLARAALAAKKKAEREEVLEERARVRRSR